MFGILQALRQPDCCRLIGDPFEGWKQSQCDPSEPKTSSPAGDVSGESGRIGARRRAGGRGGDGDTAGRGGAAACGFGSGKSLQ